MEGEMSWLLHSRLREYVVLDHFDLRYQEIARRQTPILGGGSSTTATAETVEEPTLAPVSPERTETSWIEIEMVGEDDKPIPNIRYEVKQTDGRTVAGGRLDRLGIIRATVPESSTYMIGFRTWTKKHGNQWLE